MAGGLFALIVAGSSLTGCTSASPTTPAEEHGGKTHAAVSPAVGEAGRELIDHTTADEEYADAIARLNASLPDGAKVAASMPGEYERDGRFEQGYGAMVAGLQWQCSWIIEYENAVADNESSRAVAALDALATWPTVPEVSPHLDPQAAEAWNAKVIGPARAGEDGMLLAIAAQC